MLVVDIFSGSGTTLCMAEKLNRKWIGFEISKEYCNIADTRINIFLKITSKSK
jgi:DNA modification methylase